jgi:hypothetical protein
LHADVENSSEPPPRGSGQVDPDVAYAQPDAGLHARHVEPGRGFEIVVHSGVEAQPELELFGKQKLRACQEVRIKPPVGVLGGGQMKPGRKIGGLMRDAEGDSERERFPDIGP